jgi:hypothetical protein
VFDISRQVPWAAQFTISTIALDVKFSVRRIQVLERKQRLADHLVDRLSVLAIMLDGLEQ